MTTRGGVNGRIVQPAPSTTAAATRAMTTPVATPRCSLRRSVVIAAPLFLSAAENSADPRRYGGGGGAGIDRGAGAGFSPARNRGEDAPMAERRKKYEDLRSARWYAAQDMRSFGHRSRTKQMGYSAEDYGGKPVIAILNTWSDL